MVSHLATCLSSPLYAEELVRLAETGAVDWSDIPLRIVGEECDGSLSVRRSAVTEALNRILVADPERRKKIRRNRKTVICRSAHLSDEERKRRSEAMKQQWGKHAWTSEERDFVLRIMGMKKYRHAAGAQKGKPSLSLIVKELNRRFHDDVPFRTSRALKSRPWWSQARAEWC